MRTFSVAVRDELFRAGWRPDHGRDISEIIAEARNEGIQLHPAALEFYRGFAGIRLRQGGTGSVNARVIDFTSAAICATFPRDVEFLADIVGPLCPIAVTSDPTQIVIDPAGRIFGFCPERAADVPSHLRLIGGDKTEAIGNLLGNVESPPIDLISLSRDRPPPLRSTEGGSQMVDFRAGRADWSGSGIASVSRFHLWRGCHGLPDRIGNLPSHVPPYIPRCDHLRNPMRFLAQFYAGPHFHPAAGLLCIHLYRREGVVTLGDIPSLEAVLVAHGAATNDNYLGLACHDVVPHDVVWHNEPVKSADDSSNLNWYDNEDFTTPEWTTGCWALATAPDPKRNANEVEILHLETSESLGCFGPGLPRHISAVLKSDGNIEVRTAAE